MNVDWNHRGSCTNAQCFCSGACMGMRPFENKPFVLKSENWVDFETMKPNPQIKPLTPLPFDELEKDSQ